MWEALRDPAGADGDISPIDHLHRVDDMHEWLDRLEACDLRGDDRMAHPLQSR